MFRWLKNRIFGEKVDCPSCCSTWLRRRGFLANFDSDSMYHSYANYCKGMARYMISEATWDELCLDCKYDLLHLARMDHIAMKEKEARDNALG